MAALSSPDRPADATAGSAGIRARLRRAMPMGLVLTALLAIAYWGHKSDWLFFSSRATQKASAPAERTIWVEATPGRTSDLCAEHGLPSCPSCNPEVAQRPKRPVWTAADQQRVNRARTVRERSVGDPAALRLPRVVRFASADAADAAGIDITPAWKTAVSETVAGSGELGFDPVRYARV